MENFIDYSPEIWLFVFTTSLLLFLFIYSLRRRNVPGALAFAIGCSLTAIWSLGTIFEILAIQPSTKIFWFAFQTVIMLPASTAMTCSFLEYARPGRWLSRRNLILLSIPPLMDLILTATNGSHHLMWSATIIKESVVPMGHWLGWIFVGYGNLLGLVNIAIFIWLLFHGPENRWPILLMLVGNILGRILYLVSFINQSPLLAGLPIESIPFLAYSIALFGFQIFAPIPLARQSALNQLRAGVIILDTQDKIAFLNPAAEQVSQEAIEILKNESLHQFELQASAANHDLVFEMPLECESRKENRCYNIAVSILKDWRGVPIGKLIMFNDITEQKEAQQLIIEQQLALASFREREALAHELHDTICQVLGYTSFQLDAALKLNADGKTEESTIQLQRLGNIIRETHTDLRNQIHDLQVFPDDDRPFFETINSFLDEFTEQYRIITFLEIGEGISNRSFHLEEQQQILRIIQEGLTNVYKHGQAQQVNVLFTEDRDAIRIMITDDGIGFIAEQNPSENDRHFGLKFMRARAKMIGGDLFVQSNPGNGTSIVLKLKRHDGLGGAI